MRKRGNHLPLAELLPYLLDLPETPAPLSWSNIFGNDHPVEIEVGFGKGAFLVATSLARPDHNFVGIEVDRGLQLYVANRLAKRGIANVRLVKKDALSFLAGYVPDQSLRCIHTYFPDPWWKRRHLKRRTFSAAYVAQCARVLQPGGELRVATDVPGYFQVILKVLRAEPLLQPVSFLENAPLIPVAGAISNFERKAAEQGRMIGRATFVRV